MNHDDDGDLEVIDLAGRLEDTTPSFEALRTPLEVRERARRRWVVLGSFLVLAGLIWAGVAAMTLLSMRDDVGAARVELLAGRDAIESGDVTGAVDRFEGAADTLGSLPGRVDAPVLGPVRLYRPWRATLEAVGNLGAAGELAASAARDVAAQLATNEGGLGALTPRDGVIPTGQIAALAPVLAQAAEDMAEAETLAEEVVVLNVDQQVVDGRAEFLDLIGSAVDELRLGAEVAEVLPALFGADGARRYLVLASNPAEARGTGGFLGAYMVLEAIDGRLDFGPVGETQDLPIPEPGVVAWSDPSLSARYEAYGGSSRIRTMNMTPDFPAAAQTMENYWSAVMGEDLDGVLTVDPFAFEALLAISGPVDLGELGEVSSADVVEFVTYTAYARIQQPAERKFLIGNVATQALQGFLNGPGDISPGDVLRALGRMVERDSLLIHATRPEEQAVLVQAGLAGDFAPGEGDLLAVINNSGSGSKIDYFLDRSVRYDVELVEDGAINGVVSAGFVNTAPSSGELTYMIGPPNPDVPFVAGDNVLLTSVYCAPGCTFFEVPDSGYGDLPTVEQFELGIPVASTWTLLGAGRGRELIYTYAAPGAWRVDGEDWVYTLRYEHQTATRPTSLDIRVAIPNGREPVDLPDGAEVVDDEVVVTYDATTDLLLEITFRPV